MSPESVPLHPKYQLFIKIPLHPLDRSPKNPYFTGDDASAVAEPTGIY